MPEKSNWVYINGAIFNLEQVTHFKVQRVLYPPESKIYEVYAHFSGGPAFWEKEEATIENSIRLAKVKNKTEGYDLIESIIDGDFHISLRGEVPDPPPTPKPEKETETETDNDIPF